MQKPQLPHLTFILDFIRHQPDSSACLQSLDRLALDGDTMAAIGDCQPNPISADWRRDEMSHTLSPQSGVNGIKIFFFFRSLLLFYQISDGGAKIIRVNR